MCRGRTSLVSEERWAVVGNKGLWGGVWSPQVKVVNGGGTITLSGEGPHRI